MVGFVALVGFGVTRAIANARLANFASNLAPRRLCDRRAYPRPPAGLPWGSDNSSDSRLGARAVLGAGAPILRPLIVVVSCVMALRLVPPSYPLHDWLINLRNRSSAVDAPNERRL